MRRSPSLQKTRDGAAPVARMHPASLAGLGLAEGSAVRVRQRGEAMLKVVADDGVPEGCVRIAAAHASTCMLGPMFGQIAVEAL